MTSLVKTKSDMICNIISVAFLGTAVFLMILLLGQITVYSDDYYFGTFLSYDFTYFWDCTVNHYLYSNGRMLVHFLLEVVLLADTHIYMFLCPLVICLCAGLFLKMNSENLCFSTVCFSMGISIFLLLCLRAEILRTSLLWMSGSFNFLLPMGFVIAAIYFYDAALKNPS